MLHTLNFGSRKLDFLLSYSIRKSLGISVHPDLTVNVTAPEGTTLVKILEIVRKRAPWIIRQQDAFLVYLPRTPERRFVSGETHLYLGRQYRLRVFSSEKNEVQFDARILELYLKDRADAAKVLNTWYQERANIKFPEFALPLIKRFEKYNVCPTSIQIHQMPTRWGSCTTKGKLILNPELIKAPRSCIEYIITHELCHLVFKTHSEGFFDLQYKEMPDWERWKYKLETLLA